MAVLLSELAEDAEYSGEPNAASAADHAATAFADALTRAEATAWNTASAALHQVVSDDDRDQIVAEWEQRTGWSFSAARPSTPQVDHC